MVFRGDDTRGRLTNCRIWGNSLPGLHFHWGTLRYVTSRYVTSPRLHDSPSVSPVRAIRCTGLWMWVHPEHALTSADNLRA